MEYPLALIFYDRQLRGYVRNCLFDCLEVSVGEAYCVRFCAILLNTSAQNNWKNQVVLSAELGLKSQSSLLGWCRGSIVLRCMPSKEVKRKGDGV
jgi:hypothetical protein